jgi:hypothetical protein
VRVSCRHRMAISGVHCYATSFPPTCQTLSVL